MNLYYLSEMSVSNHHGGRLTMQRVLQNDLIVFNGLANLEKEFKTSSILVTPHICTPLPLDGKMPNEPLFLNFGIYNLGFLGLNRTVETMTFLDWWEERTLTMGYADTSNRIFVDQLWIQLCPDIF